MLKVENTEVYGRRAASRGARHPKNSWDKSDSIYFPGEDYSYCVSIGPNDMKLLRSLANAGPDHGKFLRMIQVYCDITAPLYLYKELDTYRMGVEKNSCSTMHKIHAKEFELSDFSHDHLSLLGLNTLKILVDHLETNRQRYLANHNKQSWWQLIQLLPSSYNQRRTYMFSYAALRSIYHARKNHKLDEWHEFCDWVRMLPYAAELITNEEVESE